MNDLTGFDTGSDPIGGGRTGGRLSSLVDFLYPMPAKRTIPSIIGWWEKRRLPYNLMVGAAGAISLGIVTFFSAIPPLGAVPGIQMLIPVVAFGVMANVCYLLGPTVEILAHKLWGRDVLPVGPALYRIGLTFSVGLALLPALLMVIVWIARVLSVVF